ncbi:hypothetical protein HMPREF3150_02680 [Pseudomonas aeruginosa]|nr:hypothetical protein HMPREF3150_02680 [Pseudomonas aeruginosa]
MPNLPCTWRNRQRFLLPQPIKTGCLIWNIREKPPGDSLAPHICCRCP